MFQNALWKLADNYKFFLLFYSRLEDALESFFWVLIFHPTLFVFRLKRTHVWSQCTPSIFNLDQKCHGLSCFWGFLMYKRVQNQSRKTSVIRLQKSNPQKTSFSILKLALRWHFLAMFTLVNFGSLMTDVFLD